MDEKTTQKTRSPSVDTLRNLYETQELPMAQIGKIYGTGPSTVKRWLEAAGITPRNASEAAGMAVTSGRRDVVKTGGLNARSGRRRDIPDRKGGDHGGLFVRSRWEANYARMLMLLEKNKMIKGWEYEPKTFYFEGIKRGNRSYTPDFKVIPNDGDPYYVEVKGWLNDNGRVKIKRFLEYYPDIKLYIMMQPDYTAIKRKYKRHIRNWE